MKNTYKPIFISVILPPRYCSNEFEYTDKLAINADKIIAIQEHLGDVYIHFIDHYICVKNSYEYLVEQLKKCNDFSRFTEFITLNERKNYNLIIDLNQIYCAYFTPCKWINGTCFKYYVCFKKSTSYDFIFYTYTDLTKLNN